MTVARILSEKGASVATVGPEKTLGDVIHILAEKRIGALVVAHPDGTVVGIVSERDIMRALARLGAATLDAPVGDHMTANVTTCNRSTTIEDVMELMTNGR
ncbi:MAG: CBS domain-containing protein, partial [Methylobacterium sp.]